MGMYLNWARWLDILIKAVSSNRPQTYYLLNFNRLGLFIVIPSGVLVQEFVRID